MEERYRHKLEPYQRLKRFPSWMPSKVCSLKEVLIIIKINGRLFTVLGKRQRRGVMLCKTSRGPKEVPVNQCYLYCNKNLLILRMLKEYDYPLSDEEKLRIFDSGDFGLFRQAADARAIEKNLLPFNRPRFYKTRQKGAKHGS